VNSVRVPVNRNVWPCIIGLAGILDLLVSMNYFTVVSFDKKTKLPSSMSLFITLEAQTLKPITICNE